VHSLNFSNFIFLTCDQFVNKCVVEMTCLVRNPGHIYALSHVSLLASVFDALPCCSIPCHATDKHVMLVPVKFCVSLFSCGSYSPAPQRLQPAPCPSSPKLPALLPECGLTGYCDLTRTPRLLSRDFQRLSRRSRGRETRPACPTPATNLKCQQSTKTDTDMETGIDAQFSLAPAHCVAT